MREEQTLLPGQRNSFVCLQIIFHHFVSGTFFPHFLCHSPMASLSGLSTSVFWKRACTFHHKCCLSLKKDSNKHVWIIMRVFFAAGHGHRWRVSNLRCSCGLP